MESPTPRQRIAAYGVAARDGRILLVRATASAGAGHTWWLPGGGVEFGEAPSECVEREFAEETGLRVAETRLADVWSDVGVLTSEPVLLHSVRLIYDVTVHLGNLIKETAGSTDDVAWFDLHQLQQMPLPGWVRDYLATRWW